MKALGYVLGSLPTLHGSGSQEARVTFSNLTWHLLHYGNRKGKTSLRSSGTHPGGAGEARSLLGETMEGEERVSRWENSPGKESSLQCWDRKPLHRKLIQEQFDLMPHRGLRALD